MGLEEADREEERLLRGASQERGGRGRDLRRVAGVDVDDPVVADVVRVVDTCCSPISVEV